MDGAPSRLSDFASRFECRICVASAYAPGQSGWTHSLRPLHFWSAGSQNGAKFADRAYAVPYMPRGISAQAGRSLKFIRENTELSYRGFPEAWKTCIENKRDTAAGET